MSLSEMAIEILRATNDGDELAPTDLYLLQLAVNGSLNERGLAAFKALHSNAMQGYKPPWHLGIEHMTKDQEGYIYWKGTAVEHYDFAKLDEEKAAAEELAERCRYLESINVTPTVRSTVWDWDKYQSDKAG